MSRTAMSAFPVPGLVLPHGDVIGVDSGMSLHEYAAITLRVHESGDPQLDDLIRKSLRNELAQKAMVSALQSLEEFPDNNWRIGVAMDAYAMADAMLSVMDKQNKRGAQNG